MKRFICFLIACILVLPLISSCTSSSKDDTLYLNVYNWEDYICKDDECDLIAKFEEYASEKFGKKVVVNYSTFGTIENMYNELQLSKSRNSDGTFSYAYDLVCPSDYMIQRMILEGMVEKLDWTIPEGEKGSLSNYQNYASSYIRNLFDSNEVNGEKWSEYSVAYMYGTMGFVCNPEVLAANGDYEDGDENHWDLPWKAYSKNLGTIKDSIRDTYALAMGYVFSIMGNELQELAEKRSNSEITDEVYNSELVKLFNNADPDTVEKATNCLKELKENVYGFEVDSGKRDMASGKIAINFAWSGDAVYTLDLAEEVDTILYYTVPEEGSNIWFDGWLMMKGMSEERKLLAQEWINFLSDPQNAIDNMNYIGYTPAVAGEVMYDNCLEWYGLEVLLDADTTWNGEYSEDDIITVGGKDYYLEYFDYVDDQDKLTMFVEDGEYKGYDTKVYSLITPVYDDEEEEVISLEEDDYEVYSQNVSTLLNSDSFTDEVYCTILAEDINRQLMTQYPDYETIIRCTIMQHFDETKMKRLNRMWDDVKVSAVPEWFMILIVVLVIAIAVLIPIFAKLYKQGAFEKKNKKHEGMKLVSKELIK